MTDTIVIGAGLAGLISAIDLRRKGHRVQVLEKQDFPRNKVCGEYISNEVLPYFNRLELDIDSLNPVRISTFQFSAPSGKAVNTKLGMGGFSVRRFSLDEHLSRKAAELGVDIRTQTTVSGVDFSDGHFTVQTKRGEAFQAKTVIGSYGKRSVLDRKLERPFFQQKVDYVGVKTYFEAPEFPEDLVGLHNFPGGYCGLSKVENGWVNVAYLTRAGLMKQAGSVEQFEQDFVEQNPILGEFFRSHQRMLPDSLVISNISFAPKDLITDHILMAGDAAGMIPPLAGNGMAMAIHGGKMAAEATDLFLTGQLSRSAMEHHYRQNWNREFRMRLFWGRQIQRYMGQQAMELGLRGLTLFPFLLPLIVRQTHGKAID